jgi:archaellum component FlaG (FlaF/FlaG flagellin family)
LDKVIVTALLIMAGVVSAITVFNSVYPAVGQSSDAITNMQARVDEQLKTQIQIIYGTKGSDASGDTALLWVKNVGSLRITVPEASDLFFGPEGNFSRIPYQVGSPHWEYAVEGDSSWNPTRTLQITVTGYGSLPSGRYFARLVLANGISDEYYLSW